MRQKQKGRRRSRSWRIKSTIFSIYLFYSLGSEVCGAKSGIRLTTAASCQAAFQESSELTASSSQCGGIRRSASVLKLNHVCSKLYYLPLFVVIKWTSCRSSDAHVLSSLFPPFVVAILAEMQKGHHNHRNWVSLLLRRNACVPRWLAVRDLKILYFWFAAPVAPVDCVETRHTPVILPGFWTTQLIWADVSSAVTVCLLSNILLRKRRTGKTLPANLHSVKIKREVWKAE